ncbi:hypothetical protein SRHO_G00037570 [Serrasalmus rhombeus]
MASSPPSTSYEQRDELKSSCQGDSGGLLSCHLDGSDLWEMHGVVSFGPLGFIMNMKPPVFIRVSAFNHWIEDNIKHYVYENSAAA